MHNDVAKGGGFRDKDWVSVSSHLRQASLVIKHGARN